MPPERGAFLKGIIMLLENTCQDLIDYLNLIVRCGHLNSDPNLKIDVNALIGSAQNDLKYIREMRNNQE
jgi:hypothetical protein